MTVRIRLRRGRGWPRYISLLTVSLGRAPEGHVERAPRRYASASGRSTACSRFVRCKRLLLVAGGLVTKCTSRKDSLSARLCGYDQGSQDRALAGLSRPAPRVRSA